MEQLNNPSVVEEGDLGISFRKKVTSEIEEGGTELKFNHIIAIFQKYLLCLFFPKEGPPPLYTITVFFKQYSYIKANKIEVLNLKVGIYPLPLFTFLFYLLFICVESIGATLICMFSGCHYIYICKNYIIIKYLSLHYI